MSVRVLARAEVEHLLPMAECVDVMAEALKTLARGHAAVPLRSWLGLPEKRGLLAWMPAWLGMPACMGIKVISVMPGNHGTPYDSHQGAVLLFEAEHGCLQAILDASSVTAIRTAAVSGVATRTLAREDAGDLALLGSGVQAASHLAAMRVVRKLGRVRVWSRNPSNALVFADRESRRHGLRVEVADSAHAAVEDADLICAATAAKEPVLQGEWISEGAHINAVGACLPSARELDAAAVSRAALYVDRRESALAEAGDFLLARAEGVVGDDHILGELGDVLLRKVPGRRSLDQVTLFKSLGIGVEDVAAAAYVYRKALAQNLGVAIELGGLRDAHS